jgi:hypothetical protein
VSGTVITTASTRQAKTLYHGIERKQKGSTLDLEERYGNEQIVTYNQGVSAARMTVRQGRVVWELGLAAFGLLTIDEPTMTHEMNQNAFVQDTRVSYCSEVRNRRWCAKR